MESAGRVPDLSVRGVLRGKRDDQEMSFALGPGEIMGVVGPQGSGKTSFLSILGGLKRPSSGSVKVCGELVGSDNSDFIKKCIGYVPAPPAVHVTLNCWEYLFSFAEIFQVPMHYRVPLIKDALEMVGLQWCVDNKIYELKRFEQRLLGIARALVHDPVLLVIDDCLVGLNPRERKELIKVLIRVRARGRSVVASTSFLAELAEICTHLCVLVGGRVLTCGAVKSIWPRIMDLRMVQIQFLSGFSTAVRVFEEHPSVVHIELSVDTNNLVRIIFDGDDAEFAALLERLCEQGCAVVSFMEDHSFLGRGGGNAYSQGRSL